MREYKAVEIPARTVREVHRKTCDLCGTEIKKGAYSNDEVTVEKETGTSCPDGGSGVKTIFDVCLACFDSKLVPFFEQHGTKPHVEEWDF